MEEMNVSTKGKSPKQGLINQDGTENPRSG